MNIKLVISDMDGVWTDGSSYYGSDGSEFKKFTTSDSAGVLMLRWQKIPLAVITGERTVMVKRRMEKLKIEHFYNDTRNKLKVATELCKSLNISLDEVAFIGDDMLDVPLLKAVGLSASPANAPEYISKHVHWKLEKKGGEGVFREFVERIMEEMGQLDAFLEHFYEDLINS